MKQCSKCSLTKPLTEFHRDKYQSLGVASSCKDCYKIWYKQNRKKAMGKHFRQKYGLTQDAIQALVEQQNNCCLICELPFEGTPFVDHCHETEQIRGMLCRYCNTMLGMAKDNPSILRAGASYLEEYTLLLRG